MKHGGAGVDVCGLARVEAVLAVHGERFIRRVVAKDSDAKGVWDAARLARRWALKEAVAKACGTGIGDVVGFADIVVGHDTKGAPQVTVKGFAGVWKVSVADDAGVAVALALWEPA